MKFDFSKILSLVKGGLFSREETWNRYLEENPSFVHTVTRFTGPLLINRIVLGSIFSKLVGNIAPGHLGDIEHQGQLMDSATQDEFEPPSNGQLSRSQVQDYVHVMEKARALQEESAA